MLNSEEHTLVKLVYNILLLDVEENNRAVNLVYVVKQLRFSLGFGQVWIQQGVGDCQISLSVLKQRLKDTFLQTWNVDINGYSRAIFYKTFSSVCVLSYLDIINIKGERNLKAYCASK